MELILGSRSPRRQELLERMGLRFTVLSADIDETKYETEDPETSVCRICEAKARAVAQRLRREHSQSSILNSQLVLSSDTIVVLDGKILGKPHSEDEARAMLRALSGREHAVYTAFTLLPVEAGSRQSATDKDSPYTHCEKTLVKFRPLTEDEIAAYTASGEPMDKAGAYGIQGLGAMLVEAIRGDYFTVMGLPVCRLAQTLKRYGIDPLSMQEKKL